MKLDRCRFDNYDDKWNTITRPNHFHPRFVKEGFKSPMIGHPNKNTFKNFVHSLNQINCF